MERGKSPRIHATKAKQDQLRRDIIRRMDETKKLTKKEEKIISFKQNQFYTVMMFLTFALGVLVGYFIWGTDASAPVAPVTPEAPAAAVPQQDQVVVKAEDIPTEGFPSVGPEDAEITLIEFSDFGCSFCAKWHNETFEDLMAAYPDQIRFVYRDVPFRAFPASEASMCAGEQGFYWEYHDRLFSYEYGLDSTAYTQYAKELNLDMDAFSTCVNEHRYQEYIEESLDFATQELGINSTPTFYINGIKLIGAQPIGAFKKIIDQELAGN